MKKILHLIGKFDEDSGGAQRVILDIINMCEIPDVKMGVCSLFGEATLSKHLPEKVCNTNLNYSSSYSPKILFDLNKLLGNWKPDILHVHSPVVGVIGRPLAKLHGIKLISTVHNDVRQISFRNRLLDKFTIGISDSIICVSDLVGESVTEEYKSFISKFNLEIIWNCLDCNNFKKKVSVGSSEKKIQIGLQDKNFVLGTVGSLHPQKGHTYLLRAWQQVAYNFPNAMLVIIGDGKQKKQLLKLTSSIGISDSVFFLGARNDVPDLLNLMDVFIFPSLYEGLGIALLEAMCMEKIIIASDIEPLNQILGDSGILVPPANVGQLSRKITNIIKEYEHKKYLGKKAAERVREKFSPFIFGEKYSSVYKKYL